MSKISQDHLSIIDLGSKYFKTFKTLIKKSTMILINPADSWGSVSVFNKVILTDLLHHVLLMRMSKLLQCRQLKHRVCNIGCGLTEPSDVDANILFSHHLLGCACDSKLTKTLQIISKHDHRKGHFRCLNCANWVTSVDVT